MEMGNPCPKFPDIQTTARSATVSNLPSKDSTIPDAGVGAVATLRPESVTIGKGAAGGRILKQDSPRQEEGAGGVLIGEVLVQD